MQYPSEVDTVLVSDRSFSTVLIHTSRPGPGETPPPLCYTTPDQIVLILPLVRRHIFKELAADQPQTVCVLCGEKGEEGALDVG